MSEIREECGVFGIWSPTTAPLADTVYYGLFALQHRGQESCGIVINDDGIFSSYKDSGLVGDVFTPEILHSLGQGNMAVGHVRYGTLESGDRVNAQPLVVNHVKGKMAIANNGSLTNYRQLREQLELDGSIFHTISDTEVISYLIIKERLSATSIEEAVRRAVPYLEGAFTLVIMSPGKLLAVRDPRGFRPLCYGQRPDGSYVVASETCALDAAGATFIRDIQPGEIVLFDDDGVHADTTYCNSKPRSMCVFEFVYLARPDSTLDGSSVHLARQKAGEFLAKAYPVDADVVIGVPDSGLDAAMGYAKESGIPYDMGLLKNKYIGRTFIAPTQSDREDKVRIKLNPVPSTIRGKRVVMVDDSIVRGTTCMRIVRLLREAGATEVHMRVSAPPFLHPCYYGTDIDSREALIAHNHSVEEIAQIIGVDSLGYLRLEDLKHIAENCPSDGFCSACFDNRYPCPVPEDNVLKNRYDSKRPQKK